MKDGHKALVLQSRDRLLLRKLALLRILDRTQVGLLAGFRSVSRVNVRLVRLRRAGLILRYFTATSTGSRRSVYALSKRGALEAQVTFIPLKWRPDSMLLGNAFVAHQLALNDVYIAASARSFRWERPTSPLSLTARLIPDGYLTDAHGSFFIEMDMGTEILSVWTQKTGAYVRFAATGAYREMIPHPHFTVLVVANSDSRMNALRRQIAKQTQKLFWFSTLDTIKRQGFWSSSWLRAAGETSSPPGA